MKVPRSFNAKKTIFLVMQSNLDFKVSNEISGPHEPVIKIQRGFEQKGVFLV